MIVFTTLSSQPRPVCCWICNIGFQGGDATISIRASRLDWCDRLALNGNGGTHTRRHLKLALTLLASQSLFSFVVDGISAFSMETRHLYSLMESHAGCVIGEGWHP